MGIGVALCPGRCSVEGIFLPPKSPAYCDVGLEHQSATTVITVTGEVDLFAAPVLDAALAHSRTTRDPVVVDLLGCTFFDSSGLNALLRGHLEAEAAGQPLAIARSPGSSASRVLELTAPGHFPEHGSLASALAAVATAG